VRSRLLKLVPSPNLHPNLASRIRPRPSCAFRQNVTSACADRSQKVWRTHGGRLPSTTPPELPGTVVGACIWRFAPVHPPWIRGALGPASSHHYALRVCANIRTDEGRQSRVPSSPPIGRSPGGDQERDDAESSSG
jgi:hypothetical protein